MRIPVIKTIQKGVTLYIGKMSIDDLLKFGIITEWDPNLGWDLEQQGYQRAPMKDHVRRIGEFLVAEVDPLLPTSALISAREQDYGVLEFLPQSNDTDFGYLELNEPRHLFIVDYQHRWAGFRYAIEERKAEGLKTFEVPVVIMANPRRYEEIRQFYLINSKQRRIDTDLALALMQTISTEADEAELLNLVGPGKRYRIRATRLTFRIAALATGCWVGKIQEPNMPSQPSQVASPKSVADSMRPILSNRCSISQLSDDQLVEILSNFWEGVRNVVPIAFTSPQNYAIQKTPGLFSLHRVAAQKVLPLCQQQNNYSAQNVANSLIRSTTVTDATFWATGGPVSAFGGASGHKALADRIIGEIG